MRFRGGAASPCAASSSRDVCECRELWMLGARVAV